MLLTSVTQITGAFVSLAAALPLYEQIKPVLRAAPEGGTGRTRPGPLTGALEARRLSFRYSDDGPLVLDDVSFEVRPGEFVAIVGPSGCGKSTLLRLLIGFDRPLSGSVLYDGQDLAALDRSAVRRQCGVVLQHAQPFTGSILDVIRGTEPYTPEEAMAAAEMAGLAEDIARMPMGLHTVVAGNGAISGGQRQRLMIAQALIRRPRILFLDEATSALDNETQRRVIESTKALDATRVVIAHRLSTVLDADRVIVMEHGRIAEQGPPGRLLADPAGRLHGLVRRQMA
jgi:ATP-binding cassette subfamily C protein